MIRTDTLIKANMSAWLDAARGLAALIVVMGHLHAILYVVEPSDVEPILRITYAALKVFQPLSHAAVIVFFVLSGYLVGGTYLVRFMTGRDDARAYVIARFARIYTVLLPTLILTGLVVVFSITFLDLSDFLVSRANFFSTNSSLIDSLSSRSFACNLLALQMIACDQYGMNLSLWSLSNEMLYYIFFFAIIQCTRDRRYILVVFLISSLMLYAGQRSSDSLQGMRAAQYFVYFLIWLGGVGLFILNKSQFSGWGVALAAACCVVILLIGPAQIRIGLPRDVILACFVVLALFLIEKYDVSPSILKNRIFGLLAAMSFSLYAVHLPIMIGLILLTGATAIEPAWSALAMHAGLLAGTVILAWLFYYGTERHTARIRKWIGGESTPRVPV